MNISENVCQKSSRRRYYLVNNDDGFQRFCDINITTLIKHTSSKKKYARRNQMPFLTKDLSKAIMTRFILRNKFLNNKTEKIGPLMSNKGVFMFSF